MERLKRINKIYSNNTFHVRDALLIPHVDDDADTSCDSETSSQPTAPLHSSGVHSDSGFDDVDMQAGGEQLTSSCKENEGQLGCNGYDGVHDKSDTVRCFDTIFSKIDGQIKDYKETVRSQVGSPAYNDFNEMLAKIDSQIQDQKIR